MDSQRTLNPKIDRFGSCITRGMTLEAIRYGALNLSQGFPGEPPPPEVLEAAQAAMSSGKNIYADMRGLPELRDAVARSMLRFHGIAGIDGDRHVTITCGTTEAMLASLLVLVDEGRQDEVIVLEPWYENYYPQVALAGACLRSVVLTPPSFALTEELLRPAFNPRTRAIILNNPHNPTGRVFTKDELQVVATLCCEFDVIALVDEIYEHYVFDGRRHISLASLPGMSERTVTISGISKCYACTGWRVGWAVTPEALTAPVRRVHDFVTATVPTPFQYGAVVALDLPDSYFQALRTRYESRRAILCGHLEKTTLSFRQPEGAYYILAGTENTGRDSDSLARFLLQTGGVAVVPGRAYYQDRELAARVVRLTFSKDEQTLDAAGLALVKALGC